MRGAPWVHPTSISMDSWVSSANVTDSLIPEMNLIWDRAKIHWNIESIIEEEMVVDSNYNVAVNYIVNTSRDDSGAADPNRLPYLYGLMQPGNRSTAHELGTNLFHLYLFPFIGNTSQGNAMAAYGFHTVIGVWSNKHTSTDSPEKSYLTENHSKFVRGSLGQTMSHEVGHVLNLNHNECSNCLMQSDGYTITSSEITVARAQALKRASKN